MIFLWKAFLFTISAKQMAIYIFKKYESSLGAFSQREIPLMTFLS